MSVPGETENSLDPGINIPWGGRKDFPAVDVARRNKERLGRIDDDDAMKQRRP